MKMGEDTCFVYTYLFHAKNMVFVEYTDYKYLFNTGACLGRKYKMSTSGFFISLHPYHPFDGKSIGFIENVVTKVYRQ